MEKEFNENLAPKRGDYSLNFSSAKNEEKQKLLNIESQEQKVQEVESIGVPEEIVAEKIKKIMEDQTPKKKKKSTIISFCLIVINILFMAYIISGLLKNIDADANIWSALKAQGNRLWYLVAGLFVYVCYMFVQFLMYHTLIKNITGKTRLKLSYDVAVVGKYYDNVTPFAVGGQPMQIVTLAKNGISPGVSTSIPMMKMVINQIVNMVLAIFFFIFGLSFITPENNFVGLLLFIFEILGVIGLVITVIAVIFTILISSGNFVTRSLISGIIRFGYKLRLVKDYRQTLKKTINQVAEYKASMLYLWKNKWLLLKMVILSIFECLSYAVMPYFVVMAFAINIEVSPFMFLFICVVKYYICAMASSYIPLPGGTGLMEISFIFLFGIVVGDNIVWALLLWRFLSYYLILLHGFTNEIYKLIKKIIKQKKLSKLQLNEK